MEITINIPDDTMEVYVIVHHPICGGRPETLYISEQELDRIREESDDEQVLCL